MFYGGAYAAAPITTTANMAYNVEETWRDLWYRGWELKKNGANEDDNWRQFAADATANTILVT